MTASSFTQRYTLPDVRNPGMITEEEEHLYYHLARTYWRSDRVFLEVGTWLGRSTSRICQGFDAVSQDWRLTCFDLFRWHATHIPKAARGGMPTEVADLKDGDSFETAFLELMGPYRRNIRTFQGKVAQADTVLAHAFAPADKLGVVFVDASKSWENAALLRAIAPHLDAGEEGTRIVFQDFFMNSANFLHLLLMLLPQLEPETYVEEGGSLVFRVSQPLSADEPILQPGAHKHITPAMIHQAQARLATVIPEQKYQSTQLKLTGPVSLWQFGFQDEAEDAFAAMTFGDDERTLLKKRIKRHTSLAVPPLVAALGRG